MSDPVLVEHTDMAADHVAVEAAEALANYRVLVARVRDVFGDEITASLWLSRPNKDLSGEAPIQLAKKYGYNSQILEPALTKIEHGIYY